MSDVTNIEWADSTFNPWIGCTKVSPACDNCYAENLMDKRMGRVEWGAGKPRSRTSAANWKKPVQWNAKRFMECGDCGWRGEAAAEIISCGHCGAFPLQDARRRVFCASLADVFDNEVPEQWRHDLWKLIHATPNLDWLLLTKRIGIAKQPPVYSHLSWPSNVWLGITVINQEEADRDIPKLLQVPAAVHFLSVEPMLGEIDLERGGWSFLRALIPPKGSKGGWPHKLNWIICGGESGANARPMHPDWVRSLRDQCAAANVPFLFKQWGEWASAAFSCSSGEMVFRQFTSFQQWVNKASTWVQGGICLDREGNQLRNGGDMKAASDNGRFPVTIMHRVGKHTAGNTLDGRQHLEWPT